MKTEYKRLHLVCLTEAQHLNTCGYWYTVTSQGTAHTAFKTKDALYAWLDSHHLELDEKIPSDRGTHKSIRINGHYFSTYGYGEKGKKFYRLCNGRYITGLIDYDENNIANVSKCDDGAEYDYKETSSKIDDGWFFIK